MRVVPEEMWIDDWAIAVYSDDGEQLWLCAVVEDPQCEAEQFERFLRDLIRREARHHLEKGEEVECE